MTKGTKLSTDDYHKLAIDLGWSWCEEFPVPLTQRFSLWQCPHGHVIRRQYQHIKVSGFRCHLCNKIGQAVEEAKKHDLEFVSISPTDNDKITWRCSEGHLFDRSLNGLKYGSQICTVCAGLYPKTIEDYHSIADSVDYHWLGEYLPKNTLDPTLWLCDKGCRWLARYNQIQRGMRCPHPEKTSE